MLPKMCYAVNGLTEKVILIRRGENGYYETTVATNGFEESQKFVDYFNERLGVTPAQREAMVCGSMFGWDVPGADPDQYDENGKLRKVR